MLGYDSFKTLLPKRFLASGVNCGVRRYRPDLGLIVAEVDCVAVGVFTRNTCKAAPVCYSQAILPATDIRGVITNSGQANAATGLEGHKKNQQMVACVASQLQCKPKQILSASTGVIGEQIALDKILDAIPDLVYHLTTTGEKFALAILTTDLVPKVVYKEITLSTGKIHITGICKGSGMIHPNMGTMLAYFLTDAKLEPGISQDMLNKVVNDSFNMVSVDGETSTNDCVFLLGNGASETTLKTHTDQQIFQQTLFEMAVILAKRIASDGEGATKLLEIKVTGALSITSAKHLARSLTVSPLIKSAVHGRSPNWGRVISRLGQEQITSEVLDKCSIVFQGQEVFHEGQVQVIDTAQLQADMRKNTVVIRVDLSLGPYEAIAWGCDLSSKYVKINAEYV